MNIYRRQWMNARCMRFSVSHWLSFAASALMLWPRPSLGQNAYDGSPVSTAPARNVSLDLNAQSVKPFISLSTVNAHRSTGHRKKYDIREVGNRRIGDGVNLYSLKREQELGRKLATQVERSARMVTDGEVNDYLVHLVQEILRNSDARIPVKVKVLLDTEVDAYSLPGGHLYLDTGLILYTDNEAQLAGVIAHEVAHIAARHSTREETKSLLFVSTSPLIFVRPVMCFRDSRNAEREADLLGVEYQYLSGYDPQEVIRFFEKMQDRENAPTFLGRAFSPYPSFADRITRSQKDIQLYLPNKDQYIVDTADFERMKGKVRELVHAQVRPGRGEVREINFESGLNTNATSCSAISAE